MYHNMYKYAIKEDLFFEAVNESKCGNPTGKFKIGKKKKKKIRKINHVIIFL